MRPPPRQTSVEMRHSSVMHGVRFRERRPPSRHTSSGPALVVVVAPDLWEQFDTAVARFNHADAGTDAAAVADAYSEVSTAALALAEAVDAEDRAAARRARRSAGAA